MVYRCEGDDHTVVGFDTFAAKVLSGLGEVPSTLTDRGIIVEMRRKKSSEKVQRFSLLQDHASFRDIRRRLIPWSLDFAEEIQKARPQIPKGLNHRAATTGRRYLRLPSSPGNSGPRKPVTRQRSFPSGMIPMSSRIFEQSCFETYGRRSTKRLVTISDE